jgi:hypothetical protein
LDARSDEVTSLPRINGKDAGKEGDASLPRSRLKFALRRARLDEAERSEVVAELRGAEIARLEMLKEEVAPLIAELPQSSDLFDFGLVPGEHPRLFIDMIGFVEMGRDRRAYHFIQDTRHGRVLLAESERLEPIVEAITNYVARRLVEREKALAADTTVEQAARAYAHTQDVAKQGLAKQASAKQDSAKHESKPPAASKRVLANTFALLTELIGSAVIVALVAIGAREVWKYALAWWTGQ